MLSFAIGVLIGGGAALMIIGFYAAIDEEDERRHIQSLIEKKRMNSEKTNDYYRSQY